jgi:hypothetical protein
MLVIWIFFQRGAQYSFLMRNVQTFILFLNKIDYARIFHNNEHKRKSDLLLQSMYFLTCNIETYQIIIMNNLKQ